MPASPADTAEALFKEGYNCCQAVLGAYCERLGLPRETALRMAATMGGGVGGLRGTCGTITGMALVAGLHGGSPTPPDPASKKALYNTVKRMAARFTEANGSVTCRELLAQAAIQRTAADDPQARTAAYYAERPCARFVRLAAQILEDELFDSSK